MESYDWSELSELATEKIFLFLGMKDRISAALVCKKWSKVFHAPILWSSLTFDLSSLTDDNNIRLKSLTAAKKYGCYLRQLDIICCPVWCPRTTLLRNNVRDALVEFLNEISQKAQIIKFVGRMDCFEWDEELRETIIIAMMSFFLGQKRMQIFDMGHANSLIEDGWILLQALGTGSGLTLQILNLEDFFNSRQMGFSAQDNYVNAFKLFTNLHFLSINYSFLSNEIVTNFARTCCGKLEKIKIKCYRTSGTFVAIAESAWAILVKACPLLVVEIVLDEIQNFEEVQDILVKTLPVKCLTIYASFMEESETWRLQQLKSIILNHNRFLLKLAVEWVGRQSRIDVAITDILLNCHRLEELILEADLQVRTVENILRFRLENKTAIKKLSVRLVRVTDEDGDQLEKIKRKFGKLFKESKFQFYLSM